LCRAHEPDDSGIDSLRSLGGIAQNQYRLANSWGFLLQTTAISYHQPASLQRPDHLSIWEWFSQGDSRMIGKYFASCCACERIGVDGKKHCCIRGKVNERANCGEGLAQSAAEILPPMRGQENRARL
jgi:hypothetical protein